MCFTPLFAGVQGVNVIVQHISQRRSKYVLTLSRTEDRDGIRLFLAVFHQHYTDSQPALSESAHNIWHLPPLAQEAVGQHPHKP
eukprot:7784489-Pyramimonas_sp.AAC.1